MSYQPMPGAPPAVCDIAKRILIAPDVAPRLVYDPRMRSVWKWLRRYAQGMRDRDELETRLHKLPKRYRLYHWELSERLAVIPLEKGSTLRFWKSSQAHPLPDQACAAFCACVLITLGVNNPAVTRADIEEQASELSRARARLIKSFDPELAAHYAAVIANLEEQANSIETAARLNQSHYLERSRGKRKGGDDNVRAQARAIALGAGAIFGSFLCGNVATTMSVALRIDVTESNVRDWCSRLPKPY